MSLELMKSIWLSILVVIAIFVFLGREDRYIRLSMIFIIVGYGMTAYYGTQPSPLHAIDSYITRIGVTILLFRLAFRLNKGGFQ